MPKCDFSKLYRNHTLAWMLSCKFAANIQNTFRNTSGELLLSIINLKKQKPQYRVFALPSPSTVYIYCPCSRKCVKKVLQVDMHQEWGLVFEKHCRYCCNNSTVIVNFCEYLFRTCFSTKYQGHFYELLLVILKKSLAMSFSTFVFLRLILMRTLQIR